MPTANIKYLNDRTGTVFFPVTHMAGVLDDSGNTVSSKFNYIYQNYEKTEDLTSDLKLQYNAGSNTLVLKLGDTPLSTINTDNFISGSLIDSASYTDGNLVFNFTSGDTATVNLTEVLSSIISDYRDEVEALKNLHTALSEEDYEALQSKDSSIYYYTYEDDEEVTE